MLTAATLSLLGYAVYTVAWAALDILFWSRLELWANLATAAMALLLLPAAVLVRARVPGGLPLACAGLLGLQAINLHNSMHVHGDIQAVTEAARGVFGVAIVVLAWWGGRRESDAVRDRGSGIGDREAGTRKQGPGPGR